MLLRLLRTFLRPARRVVAGVIVLQLVNVLTALYLPSLNASIIDDGVRQADTATIWKLGAVMLAVTAVNVAAVIGAVYLGAKAAMGLGRDIRSRLFRTVGTFSDDQMRSFGAASLITRTTNDVTVVQTFLVMTFTLLVVAPIMAIGGIFMALQEDLGLAWLVAVAVPLLGIVVGLIAMRMLPQFRAMQTRIDTVNQVLREQISGIRVIRAFVREDTETTRFATANRELMHTQVAVGRLMSLMFPAVIFIMNASSIAVMWFGGHRIAAGAMHIGALTAFLTYLIQILMSVMMATFMLVMLPRAAVSADRIMAVLRTNAAIADPVRPQSATTKVGLVQFDRATFSYPDADAPVLSNLSFTAKPGTVTAIVGSTGSGKSTALNLIPRLFDTTAGQVLIDGINVKNLALEELWSYLGYVPQQAYLFSGTVADTVRYGKPEMTDEQIWQTLQIAQAADFVQAMPDGLASPIAQGGTNVSGGQRQRLAIARAIARKPLIYLFDDAFSALDLTTDAQLRAALRPHTKDATVIIVAQRISTIMQADQIIVLDHGVIVGIGTHDHLLATCQTYAQIVQSQAAGVGA